MESHRIILFFGGGVVNIWLNWEINLSTFSRSFLLLISVRLCPYMYLLCMFFASNACWDLMLSRVAMFIKHMLRWTVVSSFYGFYTPQTCCNSSIEKHKFSKYAANYLSNNKMHYVICYKYSYQLHPYWLHTSLRFYKTSSNICNVGRRHRLMCPLLQDLNNNPLSHPPTNLRVVKLIMLLWRVLYSINLLICNWYFSSIASIISWTMKSYQLHLSLTKNF